MERINPEGSKYIMDRGVLYALREIELRYQNPSRPEDYLHYHNTNHTRAVIRRVETIFSLAKEYCDLSFLKNDERISIFAAANHDVIQHYNLVNGKRKSLSPQNEEESTDFALKVSLKMGIFEPFEESKIKEAIHTTIPSYNSEAKTIYQPRLSANSSLPALALAISDVNGAGIDGPNVYTDEGNRLFLENNVDISTQILSGHRINTATLDNWHQRILDWSKIQIDFAKGRKILFQRELRYFPYPMQYPLENLFNKFDLSISAAKHNLESRLKLDPISLLNDLGYSNLRGKAV